MDVTHENLTPIAWNNF